MSQKIVSFKPGPIGAVWSSAYSPDNKRIAVAGEGGLVKVWDSETGRELLALKGHQGRVTSVAFSPDGQRLVAGTDHDTARIWDATTGEQLCVLKGYTSPVAFSPDGRTIATGHDDSTLRLLDSESGAELLILEGHANRVRCVAFSPDGLRIATGSDDHTSKVWNAMTGRELLVLQGHDRSVTGVVFSPDGQRVVTSSWDKTARVWDAGSGQQLLVLTGHTGALRGVAFSPDGQRIVTASDDRSVKLWEVHRGLQVLSLDGHQVEVWCVAFSPDGQNMVSGTVNPDNTARVWRAENAPTNNVWPLPDAAERIRFHRVRAEMAERENRSFAAEFHLRQVALAETELVKTERMRSLLSSEAQPENDTERAAFVALLSKRAAAYAASEQWELAVVDWKRVVELRPDQVKRAFDSFRTAERWSEAADFGQPFLEQDPAESIHWILVAPIMALSSDEADYVAFCKWIVDQPAETAVLADRSIKVCLLKPGIVDLATLPAEALARGLEEGTAPEWLPPYGWSCRALLAYRNGESDLAVKYVSQSEAHNPNEFVRAMNHAVLAMAQHERKHPDAAGIALEEASKLITGLRQVPGNKLHPDLLIAEILFREAEVKIQGRDAAARTADR